MARSPIELRERKEKREERGSKETLKDGPSDDRGHCSEDGLAGGWWRVDKGEGRGGKGRRGEGEAKTPRERENNALKQQAATTTLIGHFVHLFDLFKLLDN